MNSSRDTIRLWLWVLVPVGIMLIPAMLGVQAKLTESAVADIYIALEDQDVDRLAARVDWAHLRAWLKQDLARRSSAPFHRMQGWAAPEDWAAAVVEAHVNREGIATLFELGPRYFDPFEPTSFIAEVGFHRPGMFRMTLAEPDRDQPASVDVIFGLADGWWKVKEIHAPIYMIPGPPR